MRLKSLINNGTYSEKYRSDNPKIDCREKSFEEPDPAVYRIPVTGNDIDDGI